MVDSTTIQLVANCMDWAKHRRRKAVAKMHLRLDLNSLLPSFVRVKVASSNDAKEARAVCAGIGSGEIVVFDKAYVDFVLACCGTGGRPRMRSAPEQCYLPGFAPVQT